MKELSFKAKKIIVVRRDGTDTIYFNADLPTPFPDMGYEPNIKMETRHGYAEEWLKKVFGVEPDEVINVCPFGD